MSIKFFTTILVLIISTSTLFSQGELLSEKKLRKQKVYYNLEEASITPEKVYRINLEYKGDGSEVLKSFPNQIFNFPNLQELNISNNKINELPVKMTTLKNLQILDISMNPISELPSWIDSFKNLTFLNAGFCRLYSLPLELSNVSTLTDLNLMGNHISSFPEGFKPNTNLKKVNILRNGMNAENKEKVKTLFPNAKYTAE